MKLPILINHSPGQRNVIGVFETETATVSLWPGFELTDKKIFEIFGNVAVEYLRTVKVGDDELISQFKIRQWGVNYAENLWNDND